MRHRPHISPGSSSPLKSANKIMSPSSDSTPPTNPKRRGNPMFIKGHTHGGRPKGCKNKVVKLERCARFMEQFGWKELEYHALNRNSSKVALGALNTIAAYAYGRPSEFVDLTTDGEKIQSGPSAPVVDLSMLGPTELGMLVKKLAKEIE